MMRTLIIFWAAGTSFVLSLGGLSLLVIGAIGLLPSLPAGDLWNGILAQAGVFICGGAMVALGTIIILLAGIYEEAGCHSAQRDSPP